MKITACITGTEAEIRGLKNILETFVLETNSSTTPTHEGIISDDDKVISSNFIQVGEELSKFKLDATKNDVITSSIEFDPVATEVFCDFMEDSIGVTCYAIKRLFKKYEKACYAIRDRRRELNKDEKSKEPTDEWLKSNGWAEHENAKQEG